MPRQYAAAHQAPVDTAPPPIPESPADGEKLAIETRFGTFEFDSHNTLSVPKGLLGFTEFRDFGLANIPDSRLSRFKLLQCLNEPTLAFLVLPLGTDSDMIERGDIEKALEELAISETSAAVLLIVTVRQTGEGIDLSVNLRAPLILDTERHMCWQHVMQNNRYAVRHPL